MYQVLSFFCSYFTSYDVCHGIINHYGDVLISSVIKRYISAEYVCNEIWLCDDEQIIKLSAEEFAKELLKDKPFKTNSTNNSTFDNKMKFLHVSDVHTDLLYVEVKVELINIGDKCRL